MSKCKSGRSSDRRRKPVKPLVFSRRAITLAKRIDEDSSDPRVVWDIWCGLHSGIPECCVTFFVKFWRHLNEGRWQNEVLGEPDTAEEFDVIDVLNKEVLELVDTIQYGYFDLLKKYRGRRAASKRPLEPIMLSARLVCWPATSCVCGGAIAGAPANDRHFQAPRRRQDGRGQGNSAGNTVPTMSTAAPFRQDGSFAESSMPLGIKRTDAGRRGGVLPTLSWSAGLIAYQGTLAASLARLGPSSFRWRRRVPWLFRGCPGAPLAPGQLVHFPAFPGDSMGHSNRHPGNPRMDDQQQTTEKTCGPQLFDAEPSHSWTLEKLGEYAQQQHRTIIDGEKQLTPAYWRLGQALMLLRKQFNRGQWGLYMESLGIEPTRAARARAIYRTFPSVEQVAGKSVEEAYGERVGRQRVERRRKTKWRHTRTESIRGQEALCAFLNRVPSEAEALLKEAGRTEPAQARHLLVAVERAIEQLVQLRDRLQKHAADATPSSTCVTKKSTPRPKVKLAEINVLS
jgi:hypothetical protein